MNKLPKSWAVMNDDSFRFRHLVIRYLNNHTGTRYNGLSSSHYYGFDKDGKKCCSLVEKFDVILTIDEFIKLSFPDNQFIIGYKCPYDLFKGVIKAGTLYILDPNISCYYPEKSKVYKTYHLPKEIVETWEPVCINTSYKLGEYEGKINGHYFEIENQRYSKKDIEVIQSILTLPKIDSLNVGCLGQIKITLEDIKNILLGF